MRIIKLYKQWIAYYNNHSEYLKKRLKNMKNNKIYNNLNIWCNENNGDKIVGMFEINIRMIISARNEWGMIVLERNVLWII